MSTDETVAVATTEPELPPFEGWVNPASFGRAWSTDVPGMLTFRGNPTRSYYGRGPVPTSPRVLWRFPADGGGFDLVRKTDDQVMAERRIVYDNDHQSKWLASRDVPPRWGREANWTADDVKTPRAFTHTGASLDWVRYRHLAPRSDDAWAKLENGFRDDALPPGVVTNMMGYNSGLTVGDFGQPQERIASTSNRNFVGRQGKGARTHLVSPAMAAAAAVTGSFTDVRQLMTGSST